MTILSAKPRQPSPREVERILAGELLDAFRHFAATQTVFNERLAGQVMNNCLDTFSATFDATLLYIKRDYHVAIGTVVINNLSAANTVTFFAGGPGSGPPTDGTGVYRIGPNTCRGVSLAGREFTLWGTAADRVSVQVFTSAITGVTA